ncbi:MAG: hypothetical protein VKK62_08465 [Synechococcaceae cyanobacterium]|nr:hypothetical protein [Synechococcaceae cyanobacterium]
MHPPGPDSSLILLHLLAPEHDPDSAASRHRQVDPQHRRILEPLPLRQHLLGPPARRLIGGSRCHLRS